ncbi:MAG: thiamine-phosphate kinase [Myxococcaceae bacterium]|nr:thiamine-phosphate kinase [Myxococcaceae bacterium]MCA3013682.1 thiamine-phosphate kinase [Myxococcaceae bacterium]
MDEFARIETFLEAFPRRAAPAGPGDDAAVLPPCPRQQVVTTDSLVEGVHFSRRTFRFSDVGHKALAVNLSDVAAMGARPTWALCALQLPEDVGASDLRQLGTGMAALAAVHGVALVGGNVTRSMQLAITLTVAGEVPAGRRPITRAGARPGHLVYVSGPLGSASAGLEALTYGVREVTHRGPVTVDRAWDALVLAQRRPSPHVRWGLEASRFASAGIDVSDGLLADLGHLCAASGVGMALETGALPVLEALLLFAESEAKVHQYALAGGEDYVLAVTVPPSRAAAFERRLAKVGAGAFCIGVVTRDTSLTVDGATWKGARGFQHFT